MVLPGKSAQISAAPAARRRSPARVPQVLRRSRTKNSPLPLRSIWKCCRDTLRSAPGSQMYQSLLGGSVSWRRSSSTLTAADIGDRDSGPTRKGNRVNLISTAPQGATPAWPVRATSTGACGPRSCLAISSSLGDSPLLGPGLSVRRQNFSLNGPEGPMNCGIA
jgi:hypothetical protein